MLKLNLCIVLIENCHIFDRQIKNIETMTPENYKAELKKIKEDSDKLIMELNVRFIKNVCKFKKGDIVTDHIGSICVEKISYQTKLGSHPEFIVYGVELKKDLNPRKDGSKRAIYQSNII